MAKRVFVTGLGIITSIGDNAAQNLNSLLAGRTGIGDIRLLETIHRGVLPAGEIRHSDADLARMAGVDPEEGLTRTALLGMVAAREATGVPQVAVHSPQPAAADQGSALYGNRERETGEGIWKQETEIGTGRWGIDESGLRTGIISGSTVGGMAATEKFYPDYLSGDARNAWIGSNECSESTDRIAAYLGIRDYISTINTACSSSANAIMTATRLIRSGKLDRVLAGGTDSLSRFTLSGFNTLMIYDREPCKPFDDRRFGLNLGEGAAYLVLEAEETIGNKIPLCEVTGYGNSTDAFHQTALSPEGTGAYLAMREALDRSGLEPGRISYINAHGTATINNDLSEGKAIEKLFGSHMPPVSSTKAFTGHLLGAAGVAEAVFSVFSILYDTAWQNLNFEVRMKELSFSPLSRNLHGCGIRHVLSNSFGFGGNNTSLIFSRVN